MDINLWWLGYFLLGAFIGFIGGLLGIGGGAVIVPVLTILFVAQNFSDTTLLHLALGTSMASIVLTSASSAYAHHKRQSVRWDLVKILAPGVIIGTFSGAFLAANVSAKPLSLFFVIFMSYMAYNMLFNNNKNQINRNMPNKIITSIVGFVIGGISALVAIGGGILSVTFMSNWCSIKIHNAIGTSAAIGFPIAAAGALGYLFNGFGSADLPEYSLGFIYLPAFILINCASVFTAPIGAKVAHKLPVAILKKLFACLILLLCCNMLYT